MIAIFTNYSKHRRPVVPWKRFLHSGMGKYLFYHFLIVLPKYRLLASSKLKSDPLSVENKEKKEKKRFGYIRRINNISQTSLVA